VVAGAVVLKRPSGMAVVPISARRQFVPVRALAAVCLALAACGSPDDGQTSRAPSAAPGARASDNLILRIPRVGGLPRVSAYPEVDSLVWEGGTRISAGTRILGFDASGGMILVVDSSGRPGRLDLRLSEFSRTSRTALSAAVAGPGAAIFGVSGGTAYRFTPTDEWSYKPPNPARATFPLRDGSLMILAGSGNRSTLMRLFPPETEVLDSLRLPGVDRTIRTQIGDVIYFVADRELVGLRTRTNELLRPATFPDTIIAVEASPSGDRLFVLTRGARQISIYDRFRQDVSRRIPLPGPATDLRLGPVGQYLLARSAGGDSAWIVALGTERAIGSVRTRWREDLPFIAVDGAVATVSGSDVVFIDAETLRVLRTASGGAADTWFPFRWSGFRPRAEGIDRPVDFEGVGDTPEPADTVGFDEEGPPPEPEPRRSPAGWVVSFATVLSESRAREVASQLVIGGERPRVVMTERDGVPIYRVLLGPYPSRDEAERVGRQASVPYWVYEGSP
jgi:hypothetical protein